MPRYPFWMQSGARRPEMSNMLPTPGIAVEGHRTRLEEPFLTLKEAAEVCRRLFPSGRITERSLRTERERGRLHTFKLAGKVFTTERDLHAMIETARCPEE